MTEQHLIERQQPGAAAILRRIADQIDKLESDAFGGVAVIVPPENGGEAIELLIIDPAKNVAQFYATITTRLTTQQSALDDQSRMQQGFPRHR